MKILIRFYQCWLSPLMPSCCRFYPSCSSYALEALSEYGYMRGGHMALMRLLRCHPWHAGGIDLVPDAAAQRPKTFRK